MAIVQAANQNCRTIVSAELTVLHITTSGEVSVTSRTKVCDTNKSFLSNQWNGENIFVQQWLTEENATEICNYLTWTPAGLTGLEPDYLAAKQIYQTYLPSEDKSHKIQGCGKKCLISNHVIGFKVQRFIAKFVERAYLAREAKKVLLNYWKTLDTKQRACRDRKPTRPAFTSPILEKCLYSTSLPKYP